jgi:hypothetical protein
MTLNVTSNLPGSQFSFQRTTAAGTIHHSHSLSGELAFDVVVEFFTEDSSGEGRRFMLYGIAKKIMVCLLPAITFNQ